jgi:hypothetical protein
MDDLETRRQILESLGQPSDHKLVSNISYRNTPLNQTLRKILKLNRSLGIMNKGPKLSSLFDLVNTTLNQLYCQSYKNIIVTDLTDKNINIPVTHVIIPGMLDRIIEPQRIPHQIDRILAVLMERSEC